MEIPDEIIEMALQAVEEQLASPDTPYVKATYESLQGKHQASPEEAKELIAEALAIVLNQVILTGRPFDTKQYKQLLAQLPALPDESGEID